jgi:MraZ protein
MFIGEFRYNLDNKGRIALPAKFRKDFEKGAVVTKGLDNSLFLFAKPEWEKLAQKIAALPFSQSDARAFARLMLAGAMDIALDKQGRILIPEYLRLYAKISKKVVVVGVYDRVEIWDESLWDGYKKTTESQSDQIAERLSNLGI